MDIAFVQDAELMFLNVRQLNFEKGIEAQMVIAFVQDDADVFLSHAEVVRQPGDNSCLYHALSYCLLRIVVSS